MTDEELKLCRDIAKLERWTHVHRKGFGMQTYECWGVPPASDTRRPGGKAGSLYEIPAYLTGPAEQCRMQEELLRGEWSLNYYMTEGVFVWYFPGWRTKSITVKRKKLNVATAEGFKAMLKERG